MSIAWKPLVIAPQAEIARRVSTVLGELTPEAAVTRTDYPRMGAGAQAAVESGGNICFLDVASNSEHAQVLIAEISPLLPVVALHHRNDADLILRCLRRGACEYLADLNADAVRAVFERLARARMGSSHPVGAVYCVVPGKPGCGASSLATQLAVQLHTGTSKVLPVDCDPMNGSVAFSSSLRANSISATHCEIGNAWTMTCGTGWW